MAASNFNIHEIEKRMKGAITPSRLSSVAYEQDGRTQPSSIR